MNTTEMNTKSIEEIMILSSSSSSSSSLSSNSFLPLLQQRTIYLQDSKLVEWLDLQSSGMIELVLQCGREVMEKKTSMVLDSLFKRDVKEMKSELSKQVELSQAPLSQQMNQLQDHLSKLTKGLNTSEGKGQFGENLIKDTIMKHIPTANIITTRKETAEGDMQVELDHCRILVEVKTWARSVDTKEVEKFQADLESSLHCNAGIFASVSSGIAYTKEPYFDLSNSGKLRFYLPKSSIREDGMSLIWALHFCDLFLEYRNQDQKKEGNNLELSDNNINNNNNSNNISLWLQQTFTELDQSYETLQELRKHHKKLKAPINEMEKLINQLETSMKSNLPNLKNKFHLFMNNHSVSNSSNQDSPIKTSNKRTRYTK